MHALLEIKLSLGQYPKVQKLIYLPLNSTCQYLKGTYQYLYIIFQHIQHCGNIYWSVPWQTGRALSQCPDARQRSLCGPSSLNPVPHWNWHDELKLNAPKTSWHFTKLCGGFSIGEHCATAKVKMVTSLQSAHNEDQIFKLGSILQHLPHSVAPWNLGDIDICSSQ